MSKWNSETIRELRHKYNLSQVVLSQIVKTRQQTMNKWEQEKFLPGPAYQVVFDKVEKELTQIFQDAGEHPDVFFMLLNKRYKLNPQAKPVWIVRTNIHRKKKEDAQVCKEKTQPA